MESQVNLSIRVRKVLYPALAAGLVAAAINAVLFWVGSATGAVPADLIIPNAGQPLTIVPVIISSILPALVAGLVFFLLIRFTRNPLRIFNWVAAIVLILSFSSPFTIPNVPAGMAVVLELMHVVVAGSVLIAFNKYVKQ